jgi:hypothetical protein
MKKSIDKITIEGKDYIPVDSLASPENEGEIKIVILQRGWVMIGRLERDGTDCKLHQAYNIRRWGTEKGLGQLANEGRQENTVMDYCGLVEFDYLTVVATLTCNENLWKGLL